MIETINRIAGVWLQWQWAMLWQTTVLIGLVAVIDRLIRNRAWPQLRYALWLLVLVKLVLPPGLTSPLSVTSRIPALAQKAVQAGIQNPRPSAGDQARESLAVETAASSLPEVSVRPRPSVTNPPEIPSVQDRPKGTGPDHTPVIAPALSWPVYALGIWLAGVVTLAIGLHVRLRQISAEHLTAQPQEGPAWFEDLLAQTAGELGLQRVPCVVFSDRVCCPAVFGVSRPVLLFPADRLSMTQQDARHMLLHELAHIKRGDLLAHAGYMILLTVYWFNPLLWLIRKHLQNLRELCCDATVARHLREDTRAYRETLLATGRALLAQPVDPGLGLLGLFENSGWLLVRLQWLEKKTWRHPWLRRTFVAAIVALMLGCVLPMASGEAASLRAAGQPFTVTLPDGGTIELIGIRKTGTNEWWRPDGHPLAQAPYDTSEGSDYPDSYEFALRYENLPEGSAGQMEVKGSTSGGGFPEWMDRLKPRKAGKPVEGVTYLIAKQKYMDSTETATVRVRAATGAWKTADARWTPSGGWDNQGAMAGGALGAIWSTPYERKGRVYCTLTYPSRIADRYDVRLTALDANNVEHASTYPGGVGGGVDGIYQITPDFDLPLDDVAAFYAQTRPRTWVAFQNVSLRPGSTQKVKTVVTEPNEPETTEKRSGPPEGFANMRDFSAAVLKAFHAACIRYLDEHAGRELPKRPWALKYPLPTPVRIEGREEHGYVGPLTYVTDTGYFRPAGFQALKRADFQSSEAKRTPILYGKQLLDTGNGRGTNVLFGDGHIEWVTAERLRTLQAAPLP